MFRPKFAEEAQMCTRPLGQVPNPMYNHWGWQRNANDAAKGPNCSQFGSQRDPQYHARGSQLPFPRVEYMSQTTTGQHDLRPRTQFGYHLQGFSRPNLPLHPRPCDRPQMRMMELSRRDGPNFSSCRMAFARQPNLTSDCRLSAVPPPPPMRCDAPSGTPFDPRLPHNLINVQNKPINNMQGGKIGQNAWQNHGTGTWDSPRMAFARQPNLTSDCRLSAVPPPPLMRCDASSGTRFDPRLPQNLTNLQNKPIDNMQGGKIGQNAWQNHGTATQFRPSAPPSFYGNPGYSPRPECFSRSTKRPASVELEEHTPKRQRFNYGADQANKRTSEHPQPICIQSRPSFTNTFPVAQTNQDFKYTTPRDNPEVVHQLNFWNVFRTRCPDTGASRKNPECNLIVDIAAQACIHFPQLQVNFANLFKSQFLCIPDELCHFLLERTYENTTKSKVQYYMRIKYQICPVLNNSQCKICACGSVFFNKDHGSGAVVELILSSPGMNGINDFRKDELKKRNPQLSALLHVTNNGNDVNGSLKSHHYKTTGLPALAEWSEPRRDNDAHSVDKSCSNASSDSAPTSSDDMNKTCSTAPNNIVEGNGNVLPRELMEKSRSVEPCYMTEKTSSVDKDKVGSYPVDQSSQDSFGRSHTPPVQSVLTIKEERLAESGSDVVDKGKEVGPEKSVVFMGGAKFITVFLDDLEITTAEFGRDEWEALSRGT